MGVHAAFRDADFPAAAALVSRCIDAMNRRDLDGTLACLAPDVEFEPLPLIRSDDSYNGHARVRRWFAESERLRLVYRIDVVEISAVPDGRVLAAGVVSLPTAPALEPFCGLHRAVSSEIASLRHYFSDPATMGRLRHLE